MLFQTHPLSILSVLIFTPIFFLLCRLAKYFIDPHDLRRFPSLNLLAPLTNLSYIIFLSHHSIRSRSLHTQHEQFAKRGLGPIIRIGPTSLSIASLEAVKDIYGHSTPCIKGDMYNTTAGPHRSILDVVDRQQHAEKRKRLAGAFAAKHLEAWEWKVGDKVERLMRQIDGRCRDAVEKGGEEAVIDWRVWSNLFTVEAIADIALSKRLGLLERGNDVVEVENGCGERIFVNFVESLHGLGRSVEPIVWSKSGYPILKRFAGLLPRWGRQWKNNGNFGGFCRLMVKQRLEQYRRGEELDDFFSCLMEDKAGNALNLDSGEVAAEVKVFMDAGSDTTAIALTHVLYFLLKHPEKLQKLREELCQYISDDAIIPSYCTIRHCTYLRACLDESLRLFPPVSFGLQRKTPSEGMPIAGHRISGNVNVSVPAYTAHRDPAVFPDPEAFRPERWLGDDAKEKQKYFIAFSAGARGCIGKNITYLEQSVLIASIVRRCDFELLEREWEIDWEERFNLWPKSLPVKVKHRV